MSHEHAYMKKKCLLIIALQLIGLTSFNQIHYSWHKGAITRGDSIVKTIYLVFTGDEFADGSQHIISTLKKHNIRASFFFTGRFYRKQAYQKMIHQLKKDGHYLGAHSNDHLLYCDWNNRDSLLVTKEQFREDLLANYDAMKKFGINYRQARYFLPPYEWYNDSIAAWTRESGFQLINYTPGTLSHADYTTPRDKNYRTSQIIYESIAGYETTHPQGLNGFILLMHIGTDPLRTDKFYNRLDELIDFLKAKKYQFRKVDHLKSPGNL